MDYPYENLGPEKFQYFCQALLTKEYPGVQCFPVAQPDGGRDATQIHLHRSKGKEFGMFQVKYVRNPQAQTDPHIWVNEVMAKEAPKVKKQIKAGVTFFVLMTNVSGTAHLDSGSIDKINKNLTESLGIPSICWWRNDLSRRLDGIWDLKWTYPELMTGPDLIRCIIEGSLSENKERRSSIIRTFVTNQYVIDQYVKFKQVDLDNKLLDLFIDVPISPSYGRLWQHHFVKNGIIKEFVVSQHISPTFESDFDDYSYVAGVKSAYLSRNRRMIGAASFLLGDPSFQKLPFTVIEGAPGQGKSTIAQYLCQIHRMRLLNKKNELLKIPEDHKNTPLRLPIKVDLRDFALWLTKRNPFTAEAEEISATLWEKSLEAFLAALIKNHSGGGQFDVSDLHSVARVSSLLLVLDGLDEVADIKKRAEIVSEITKGSDRLHSISASLQVVVTSRPAAFENSPGLPEDKFRYLSLDSVSQELIDEYAGKWLKASKLDEREGSEVKKILRDKLSQPHIRDLARNPMQLAILLSLIHKRGVSLPDKRTALYDSYIEHFFNRESEKSMIVRDNRDLLIDIHRYLAWLLHVESEQYGKSNRNATGAIEEKRLKKVLKEYLVAEGYNPELADILFTGMIERVVALVSRVQGTYEFEVQPLREYFAARFLHETAPYSPVGNEKKGTRPDRFDAIARNFYWLNVTRFYAGCYSKGELASLIDCLSELIKDPDFKYLSHPRILGATLLGDWVFTQHPKSVSVVVREILDGIGLRFLLTSTSRRQSNSQSLILPIECGRSELVEKCFHMLGDLPPLDYALDVVELLKANINRSEISARWKAEALSVSGLKRTAWLEYGVHLGCVPTLDISDIQTLFSDEDLSIARVNILLKSRWALFLESDNKNRKLFMRMLLDRRVSISMSIRSPSISEAFGLAIDPRRYAIAFMEAPMVPLSELLKRYRPKGNKELDPDFLNSESWDGIETYKEIIETGLECERIEASRWASELEPWDIIVNKIIVNFGENWAARQLANVASGIKSALETCTDCPTLNASTQSLCRRARYARLRAGAPKWWELQFGDALNMDQKMFVCLLHFTWASSNSMLQIVGLTDLFIKELPSEKWEIIFDLVEQAVEVTRPQFRDRRIDIPVEEKFKLNVLSSRTLALLHLRSGNQTSRNIYEIWINKNEFTDTRILRVFRSNAIDQLVINEKDVQPHLDVLSAGYSAGLLSEPYAPHEYSRRDFLRKIPVKLAIRIVDQADRFPGFLVVAAENRCKSEIAENVRPVGIIAEEDGWFK